MSAVPESSAALTDRLGRWFTAEEEPPPLLEPTSRRWGRRARAERRERREQIAAQDAARASQPWGVTYGGVDLGRVPLDEVRRTILVSDSNSRLFAGALQDAVDPHGVRT